MAIFYHVKDAFHSCRIVVLHRPMGGLNGWLWLALFVKHSVLSFVFLCLFPSPPTDISMDRASLGSSLLLSYESTGSPSFVLSLLVLKWTGH